MSETVEESQPPAKDSATTQDETIWDAKTPERGFHQRGRFFIKRSLRPSEYMTTWKGNIHVPQLGKERIQNEGEALKFISENTDIPVPTIYGAIDVDNSYFLITEYIDGVTMASLLEDQKKLVRPEIEKHLATLRNLRSDKCGGPSGLVLPPYRAMDLDKRVSWTRKTSENREYVFCHNDLSQHNIIVDPVTLKINAIIDWEYSGFFPEFFEAPFYKRSGPSVALEGEEDDSARLLGFFDD